MQSQQSDAVIQHLLCQTEDHGIILRFFKAVYGLEKSGVIQSVVFRASAMFSLGLVLEKWSLIRASHSDNVLDT